ncbi:MAG: hypothetical protein JNG90_01745, partial [Planctomycetaceae bacterium]|nr:hypothetical protein [Planctomycetaceae bacterium]
MYAPIRSRRTWRRALAGLLVLAGACSKFSATAAEPATAVSAEAIVALVRQLDDDSFEVRRRAQRELIELGEPAVAPVRQALASPSAEVRARAREIVRQIEHQQLLRAFQRLARPADDRDVDLEAGLMLVAQIVDPDARTASVAAALDALAERVRKRVGTPVKDADPKVSVEAIRQVLFVEEAFDGNRQDYENPANSSIVYVLETKRGLPILLSQVVLAVARRVDLPLAGLALPGRFMVKYDDRRSVPADQRIDLVIDPFEQGRVLTLRELREYLPDLSAEPE